MNTPQENINKIDELKCQINSHPLCLQFKESANAYWVAYPAGYRCEYINRAKAEGKIKALEEILKLMEKDWNIA